MNDIRSSLYIVGNLLVFFSFYMTIPGFLDFMEGGNDWVVFATVASLCFFVGLNVSFVFKNKNRDIGILQAFVLTLLCWIILTFVGSIPFFLGSPNLSFVDSFFESMSGITTTGATIITDLDSTPKSMLIWRAMLQWLGGIGIIVIAIAVFPVLRLGGMQLFKTEFSARDDKVLPRTKTIALGIGSVYLLLTFVCFIFLVLAGMGLFDAIAHSMTIIATGGFSTKNMSIGFFDSIYIEITTMVFMLISALPFLLILQTFKGRIFELLKNSQVQFFFVTILILVFVTTFWLQKYYEVSFVQALRIASFSIISVTTGSGFSTYDFSTWGSFTTIILLFFMLIGGCSGSSSCGLKVFRLQILLKNAISLVKKIIQPRGVFIPSYNSKSISLDVLSAVTGFFFLYILTFAILTLILSFNGLSIITSMSGAAAALANVGPGLGDTIGPSSNYSTLSDFTKIMLSIGMLVGRLELYPLLILFSVDFWRN